MYCIQRAILKTAAPQVGTGGVFDFAPTETSGAKSIGTVALAERALRLASAMQRRLDQQAYVLIVMPHGVDFAATVLACFAANVVAIPFVLRGVAVTTETLERIRGLYGQIAEEGSPCFVIADHDACNQLRDSLGLADGQLVSVEDLIREPHHPDQLRVADADDLAMVLFSSGSTGRPKGIPLSHRNLWHQICIGRAQWRIGADSRIVTWLSPSHNFGLNFGFLVPFFAGASCNVLLTQEFAKCPAMWFKLVAEYKATHIAAPNFALDYCCEAVRPDELPLDALTSVEYLICGGEPVRKTSVDRFFGAFAVIGARADSLLPHYGLSECGSVSTAQEQPATFAFLDAKAIRSGRAALAQVGEPSVAVASCGPVADETDIRIVDSARGVSCAHGDIGEVWLRSPSAANRYLFTDPEESSAFEATIPDTGEPGFFRTGDLGFLDGGRLYITGRKKELIIQRGMNHFPGDIEATIVTTLGDVRVRPVVFSVEQDESEQVVLVLALDTKLAERDYIDLSARVRSAVSEKHGLVFGDVVFIERSALLEPAVSKFSRQPIKDAYQVGDIVVLWRSKGLVPHSEGQTGAEQSRPKLGVLRERVFAKVLGRAARSLGPETDFASIGLDSLQCARLAGEIELVFGVRFNPAQLFELRTLQEVADHLDATGQASLPDLRHTRIRRTNTEPLNVDQATDLIAVVGMHSELPGAGAGVDAFWDFLEVGGDAISRIECERPFLWSEMSAFPNIAEGELPRWAGLLKDVDAFDAEFFGISRREAECMDPQQRKVLEFVWQLAEVSGVNPEALNGRPVGLFVGAHTSDYADIMAARRDLMAQSGAYIDSGSHLTMIPNRTSRWLNLTGPSEVVNTACSSSLTAIHRAVDCLRQGKCESAIVVGVNLILSPRIMLSSAQAGMLAATGRCRTFDSRADGFVRSEGIGGVILKPLKAAIAAGDHVHGLIRSIAVNHDGRSNSLRAPNGAAQKKLLVSAYEGAGIDPASVNYVEMHGTGTALGDPIEVRALSEAFRILAPNMTADQCALGSVKSNIGHTESAAGIVGLIKVMLAFRQRMLPKTLHFEKLNPNIELEGTPFRILAGNEPWSNPDGEDARARRAGVSSFGFGGCNAHAVLEEYVEPPYVLPRIQATPENPAVVVLSARNEERLNAQVVQLLGWMRRRELTAADLADVAYTLQVGRAAMESRLAMVAGTPAELEAKLQAYLDEGAAGGELFRGDAKRNPDAIALLAADEDMVDAVGAWIAKRKYNELLQLWVNGLAIDWGRLHGAQTPRRISLPAYPFARTRYWVPAPDIPQVSASAPASELVNGGALYCANTSNLADERSKSRFSDQVERDGAAPESPGASGECEHAYEDAPAGTSAEPSTVELAGPLASDVLEARVRAAIVGLVSQSRKIAPSQIDPDVSVDELGFDSIGLQEIARGLRQYYGLELSPVVFFEHSTINRLASHLSRHYREELTSRLRADDLARVGLAGQSGQTAFLSADDASINRRASPAPLARATPAQSPSVIAGSSEPIAIIGISGCFPEAPDVDALWRNLLAGRDCIGALPPERWGDRATIDVPHAGVIEGLDQFDPLFFGISPREAEGMDPQQRLLMTHVWKVIEEAGYAPQSLAGSNTAILVGTENSGYGAMRSRAGHPVEAHSAIGMVASMGPNRMSYLLDLHGPSEPIETACSSSLVAIHRAVGLLQTGQCDLAVAGGVNTVVSLDLHASFSRAGMLSKDGRCRTFSAHANGYVRGEGVGMLMLKPLRAAERDGDHIYGLVRGGAVNHGGRANSLTAPNPTAQAAVIAEAVRRAGVDPRTITYIEAHGTGTPLGDPIEMQGLKRAFAELNNDPERPTLQYCGLGSIKSNIGHLELAAGAAGVIKVLLMMKHQTLVRSLHSEEINPHIHLSDSPFYIVRENGRWESLKDDAGRPLPRRAGVSSFGAGGVNAHLVLEEYIAPKHAVERPQPAPGRPALVVLSARNQERLKAQAEQLLEWVATRELTPADLEALAYTLQVGRDAMECRLAFLAESAADLQEKLNISLQGDTVQDQVLRGPSGPSKSLLAMFATNGELQAAVQTWIDTDNRPALARLWVEGFKFDWNQLYASTPIRRLSLPTYPFAKERYWIQQALHVQRDHDPAPVRGSTLRGVEEAPQDGGILLRYPQWVERRPIEASGGWETAEPIVVLCGVDGGVTGSRPTNENHITIARPEGSIADVFSYYTERVLQFLQRFIKTTPSAATLIQIVLSADGDHDVMRGLSGLLKTAGLENPNVLGQVISLDRQAEDRLTEVLRENSLAPGDRLIRYHEGQRLVLEWRDLSPDGARQVPWKEKGVYLITGGMGGLGRKFASEIARKVEGANLVLIGRSSPNAEQETYLRELRGLAAVVEYREVDVANREAVAALVQDIGVRFGHLDGILHTAGVTHDSFLLKKTAQSAREVLSPKVHGLLALDEATKDIALDFFIAFSSIVGVRGNIGQADYAAANGFMDAYAAYRNRLVVANRRRGRTLSLNWPPWAEGGMQIDAHTRQALFREMGIVPMQTDAGIEALYRAWGCDQEQLLVAQGDVARIRQSLEPTRTVSRRPAAKSPTAEPSSAGNVEAFERKVLARIKELMAASLKLPPHQVDPDAPLDMYGIDSLMIKQLTSDFEDIFGPLSKTLFFEFSTIRALSRYFIENHKSQLQETIGAESEEGSPQPDAWVGREASSRSLSISATPERTERTSVARAPDGLGEDIAIVGLSGRYPGANDLETFWRNLSAGEDSVSEIPLERWDHTQFFDEDPAKFGKTYSKWGGFIDGVDEFDPLFFNISPREAEFIDPQERLFLQCAHNVLEDAGYTAQTLVEEGRPRNVAVYVGVMYNEYQLYGAQSQLRGLPVALNGISASIANRVSYFLDLHGPSMTVDTMCSSSLTAVHLACKALKDGDCCAAIVGGVNLLIHPNKYLGLAQGRFLSTKGRCESFGQGGDGYVPAEGVGAVLLKPRSQAIADGDHIYGVIRGSAVNNGGRTNGYSVPNPNAQADVIRRALAQAGIEPRTISYVEAHGTGTALGDPIEIAGLSKVFRETTTDNQFCAIGSVKSNIGHCESAAGIAALTKVLLQLQHGQLTPSLHSKLLNPSIDFENSPFRVQQTLQEWERPELSDGGSRQKHPRRAGISSFGAGGANAHLVVEEFQATSTGRLIASPDRPAIIVLSARTEEALRERCEQLLLWLRRRDLTPADLADVAYTLQVGREAMDDRWAMIARNAEELDEGLRAYLDGPRPKFQGNVKDSRRTITSLAGEEEAIDRVDALIAAGEYGDLLTLWTKGLKVDWRKLYGQHPPRRVSLPTYPFAKDRYWAAAARGGNADGLGPQTANDRNEFDIPVSPPPAGPAVLSSDAALDQIIVDKISKLLKIDPVLIDIGTEFVSYGLDSVLAIALRGELSQALGVELSPVALFENPSVEALRTHILDQHGEDISRDPVIRPARTTGDGDRVAPLSSPADAVGLTMFTVPDEHPIAVSLYYPSSSISQEVRMGAFSLNVAINGEPPPSVQGLIVISHGIGGNGLVHHNIAQHLAAKGYLVAAPQHPLDTLANDAPGSVTQLLERPRQLSKVLTRLLDEPRWGAMVPPGRIGAIGHSGGGASVLALLGGRPKGLPASEDGQALLDHRIGAALLMAPMGIEFEMQSLRAISTPLRVYLAERDEFLGDGAVGSIQPADIPSAEFETVGNAGHFSFMASPSVAVGPEGPTGQIQRDPAGFDRAAFHARLLREIESFFSDYLPLQEAAGVDVRQRLPGSETRPKTRNRSTALTSRSSGDRPDGCGTSHGVRVADRNLERPAAMMFPGQGSQARRMGIDLFDRVPEFLLAEKEIDELLGYSVRELCTEGPEEKLRQTAYTQPCLYVVNALHFFHESANGRQASHYAGHSLGEYNALLAAGVVDFMGGLRLVQRRGKLMGSVKGGGMAAVIGLCSDKVADVLGSRHPSLDIANFNSPRQTVISGPTDEIIKAEASMMRAGAQAYIQLPVSAAFHSRYMADAASAFEAFLATCTFKAPTAIVMSNVTARPYLADDSGEATRKALVEQIVRPVKWMQSMQYLLQLGVADFAEVGPGVVLDRLLNQIRDD